ncbi:MFS transporter [Parasphingopyxis sp.]|uniref:spinster family MFS transporter n=1 Tax=Parasphingopyxis sp. TaxID=1920299 RepID=UPI002623B164|nr:MFS transporter [Parasphingopyxis sp.]
MASRTLWYPYYLLGLIFLINILNVADKMILGVLIEQIKAEFGLSDTQLGFLSGLAFAVVYSILGLPLARLADRSNRRNLISACLGLWSLSTALCGMALNFLQLLGGRLGVAVGEAGFTPATHSLIADYFPRTRRGFAMAVYSLGSPFGQFAAVTIGGMIAATYGWRVAFFAFGIPGLLLALLFRLSVKEPKRGAIDGLTARDDPPPIGVVARTVWQMKTFRNLMFASSLHAFILYGVGIWAIPFFLRSHDWDLATIGLWFGSLTAIFGGIGAFAGGALADRLGRSDIAWYLKLPAWSIFAGLPLAIAGFLVPQTMHALLLLAIVSLFWSAWQAPTFAIIQTVAPLRMRATAAAVLIFTINLVGFGLGPLAVGALSDLIQPLAGEDSLRFALLATLALAPLSVILFFRAAHALASDTAIQERGDTETRNPPAPV